MLTPKLKKCLAILLLCCLPLHGCSIKNSDDGNEDSLDRAEAYLVLGAVTVVAALILISVVGYGLSSAGEAVGEAMFGEDVAEKIDEYAAPIFTDYTGRGAKSPAAFQRFATGKLEGLPLGDKSEKKHAGSQSKKVIKLCQKGMRDIQLQIAQHGAREAHAAERLAQLQDDWRAAGETMDAAQLNYGKVENDYKELVTSGAPGEAALQDAHKKLFQARREQDLAKDRFENARKLMLEQEKTLQDLKQLAPHQINLGNEYLAACEEIIKSAEELREKARR